MTYEISEFNVKPATFGNMEIYTNMEKDWMKNAVMERPILLYPKAEKKNNLQFLN